MQQRSRPSFYRRRMEAAAAMVVVCNGGRIIKSDSPPASKKQKNPAITALIIALPPFRSSSQIRMAKHPPLLFSSFPTCPVSPLPLPLSLPSLFPPFSLGSMNGGMNEQEIIFLPVLHQTFDFFIQKFVLQMAAACGRFVFTPAPIKGGSFIETSLP